MSNLKLPVMNFGNLNRLVGDRYAKRIAHNTTATGNETFVSVYYHNNFIGEVWQGGVYLNTAGWATQTTVARLNAMLKDSLPATPYSVCIRDGAVCLTDNRDKKARHYFRDVIVYDDGTLVTEGAWSSSLRRDKAVA